MWGGLQLKMELIHPLHSDNECFYPQVSEGLVLRDGTRLKYPINGIIGSCFMLVLFPVFRLYCVIMKHFCLGLKVEM